MSCAPTLYFAALSAVSGLAAGSFVNCFAYRYANGGSVLRGRSRCAKCGHVLSARDLVPVLSWVLLRGKCRYCKERISAGYAAAELLCAAAFLTVFLRFGFGLQSLRGMVFVSLLLTAALSDLYCGMIPDRVVLTGMATALAFALPPPEGGLTALLRTLLGGAATGLPVLLIVLLFDKLSGRETMGGGDIKLIFVSGLYLGWSGGILMIVLACAMGLLFAAVRHKRGEFTFAPAIAAASWLTLLFGDGILGWYTGLFNL